MGCTTGAGLDRAWLVLSAGSGLAPRPEGTASAEGRVMGRYVRGLFGSDTFRAHWLEQVGAKAAELDFITRTEASLDDLADHIEAKLELDLAH